MECYVQQLAAAPERERQARLLARIVAEPAWHGRLVNTLAQLEYIGVRKMLKARRAEALDLDGLQHAVEEAGHALRLKKAALALCPQAVTFAPEHTLAGAAAEDYFQAVDRAGAAELSAAPEAARGEGNYLLTSAVIEIRAQAFYPLYESCLRAAGAPFSVAAIQRDEDRHLAAMGRRLQATLPAWRAHLERVLAQEQVQFAVWMQALEGACPQPIPAATA